MHDNQITSKPNRWNVKISMQCDEEFHGNRKNKYTAKKIEIGRKKKKDLIEYGSNACSSNAQPC